MDLQKYINHVTVKPIKVIQDSNQKPPHHWELFPEPLFNCAIISKKKSGKTTVIFHMIKKCLGKDTKVIIFCSTVEKDKNWKVILDYIENKGNTATVFTSIKDEQGNDKLSELLTELQQTEEEEEVEEKKPEIVRPNRFDFEFGFVEEGKEKAEPKPREPKYYYPKYIIIFDDLSNELKSPYYSKLVKTHRHFEACTITSTQYVCDLRPESLKQMDYLLLFKSFDRDKLDKIYTLTDINLGNDGKDRFWQLYQHATEKRFSFLYIDRENKFRRNFYPQYNLTKFFSRYNISTTNASTKTQNNPKNHL